MCRGRGRFIGVGRRESPGWGRVPGGWGGPLPARVPPGPPLGTCEMGVGGRRTLLGESRGPNQDDFGAKGKTEGIWWC